MIALRRLRARATALVGTVAVAVLLLGGCSLLPTPATTSTPQVAGASAAELPFYGQRLVWNACGQGFRCTTAKAPLDWAKPDSGATIRLSLVSHLATGKRLGTLFVNPGGPGVSGVTFLKSSATAFFGSALLEHYDIVAWDPRGVGASSAVSCYDTAQLDQFLFADPTGTDAEIVQQAETAGKAFGAACKKRTGALLGHVDTVSTVRDLDMLRAAVGERKLDYFGFSYGTQIGAEYADRFPTRVGRMVLDGVLDPSVNSFQVNLAQTTAFGNALRAYLRNCLAAKSCPVPGTTVQQAIDAIAKEIIALRASPIRASDGRSVNGEYLRVAIDAALYDTTTWSTLTSALAGIRKGDPTGVLSLADSYVDRADGTYQSNSFEAIYAITCLDQPVERDRAVLQRQNAKLLAADPLRAADSSPVINDPVCSNWPVAATGKPARVKAKGAPPIVLIGTTGDPATPYAWARSVATQLPGSVLITYRGEGHTAYRNHIACVNDPVEAYLVKGTVPKSGIVCS